MHTRGPAFRGKERCARRHNGTVHTYGGWTEAHAAAGAWCRCSSPHMHAHGTRGPCSSAVACSCARLLLTGADGHDVEFVRTFGGKRGMLLFHVLEKILAVGLFHKALSHPALAQLLEPFLRLTHATGKERPTSGHAEKLEHIVAFFSRRCVSHLRLQPPWQQLKRVRHATANVRAAAG